MNGFMNTHIPEKSKVAISFPGRSDFRVVPPNEAYVRVFDRSFHFGDSVYEVVRTYDGVLFGMKEHTDRLRNSMKLGLWAHLPDFSLIERMIKDTCRQYFSEFGRKDLYVRVTVSRGIGDTNIDPTTCGQPYAVVIAKEIPPAPDWHATKGVEFATVQRRRNSHEALPPSMKSGNYLNNVLAIVEAKHNGGSDAVMVNAHGFVTEGTTNNLFIVKNGVVWTPSMDAGILEGITRAMILNLCRQHKIPVEERLFTIQDVFSCEELFLSSTTREIVPITKLDGQAIGNAKPGPVTVSLRKLLREHIASEVKKQPSLFEMV